MECHGIAAFQGCLLLRGSGRLVRCGRLERFDGEETPALFRPPDSTSYFRHTLTQGNADTQFTWHDAGSGWLPVSGDSKLDEFDQAGG